MEIVSEADMSSPEEAFAYLPRSSKSSSTAESAMPTWKRARCAATSTSRSSRAAEGIRHKVELKNLQQHQRRAARGKYEIARQIEVVTNGGLIEQQTAAGTTTRARRP